jgi:Mg-chelatase subunit ChlD
MVEYDEIVISNVDVRDIRNVNAFLDSLDMAISQYGKSLITFGDLRIQTDAEDPVFNKFEELLPVKYGSNNREGRLYTIVLDVSHSMFMASKFTTAKQAAIKLLSVVGDEDYVCLVTFSGEIKVETPKKAAVCRQDLIAYIDSLTTEHGTDIGLGMEEALKAVQALRMEENHVMLISDGFSFDSTKDAVAISKELYAAGATVSAINTYIPSDGNTGRTTMQNIVKAGKGGKSYPENNKFCNRLMRQ